MTKGLNIYKLSRVRDEASFNIMKKHDSRSEDKRTTQYHEMESFRFFVNALMSKGVNVSDLDGFFYGYSISRIGKEFDLLRITKEFCLNIELKSLEVSKDQILKQLLQNKYYLNHLERRIRLFTIVTDSMTCYRLSQEGTLRECDLEEVVAAVKMTAEGYIDEIDPLFKHSKYMVSPINTPGRFIDGEYFLTQAQDVVKTEILKASENAYGAFFQLTGMPGTGKTLLLYDLAKVYAKESETLMIHCGELSPGQISISQMIEHLQVISINDISEYDLTKYRYILVDETHRVSTEDFENICRAVKKSGSICIFSIDPRQLLTTIDKEKDISGKIEKLGNVTEFKLSERIRYNKEIRFFILQLMDKRNKPKDHIDYDNISLAYADTSEEAQELLGYFRSLGYTFINYSEPKYYDSPFKQYEEDIDTDHVAGKEYDNVVMLLDESFYYDERGRLQGIPTPDPDYLYPNLFYQGITRAREKLAAIVIRNRELFDEIAKILE